MTAYTRIGGPWCKDEENGAEQQKVISLYCIRFMHQTSPGGPSVSHPLTTRECRNKLYTRPATTPQLQA